MDTLNTFNFNLFLMNTSNYGGSQDLTITKISCKSIHYYCGVIYHAITLLNKSGPLIIQS